MAENLDKGSAKQYKPQAGHIRRRRNPFPVAESLTYADKGRLRRELDQLIKESKAAVDAASKIMNEYALRVDDDRRLKECLEREWPKDLGDTGEYISYRYYDALKVRKTTSASLIRKRYEEAARDVNGTNAIDILALSSLIHDEAIRIREFVDEHIGSVDDTSEERTCELFQDWVETARFYQGELRSILSARGPNTLGAASLASGPSSAEEAVHGQAVYAVKLNAFNGELLKEFNYLRKNHSDFAPVFFQKFLGPALKFRLDVSRRVYPLRTNDVIRETNDSLEPLDGTLRSALGDQYRRNSMFRAKMDNIVTIMRERDRCRSMVHVLASKGKVVPSRGRAALVRQVDDKDYKIEPSVQAGSTQVKPSHNLLDDREDPKAHPQYFLRKGGELEGDVTLKDGVKIDGLVPSTHAHTGADGSTKISGTDIEGGTLQAEAVDPNATPSQPTDVQTMSFAPQGLGAGAQTVDAVLEWEGNDAFTYDVQYIRID